MKASPTARRGLRMSRRWTARPCSRIPTLGPGPPASRCREPCGSPAWRTIDTVSPFIFSETFAASSRRCRLSATSCVLRVSKTSRFCLVARNAFFCGNRKLRAKPGLTLTTSPIWPRRSMRSSRITCTMVVSSNRARRRAAETPPEMHPVVDEPDHGDQQDRPAEHQDEHVEPDQRQQALPDPLEQAMDHAEPGEEERQAQHHEKIAPDELEPARGEHRQHRADRRDHADRARQLERADRRAPPGAVPET